MKILFENSRTLALRLSLSAGAVILLAACNQQPTADTQTPVDANSAAPAAADMDGMSTATAEEKSANARGVISAIDAERGKITIEHEPIASLGWPAMTMPFAATPALIAQAKVGDRVEFDMVFTGSAGEVKAIRPQ